MDILITLFYLLFAISIVYPPTEFISAGFTISQLFEKFLGSEENNFIKYHMKRITITVLIHACLPMGYVVTLWCCGERGEWTLFFFIATSFISFIALYKIICWWEYDKFKHPVVKALLPYVTPESDWRIFAANFNVDYRGLDKVSISLNNVSKVIATQHWILKVSQYSINIIHQNDCTLVATATDTHELTPSGENEIQYVNIEVIPSNENVKPFSFRLSTIALRELQPRLQSAIRVPEHISLIPPLIERFVNVFREHVSHNPKYNVDQDLEPCIVCMQNQADVKINKRCVPNSENTLSPSCQPCNCRVLWCVQCLARWWATRLSDVAPNNWLSNRGTCPLCRSVFCLMDVSLVEKIRTSP